jgi:predicted Zn-dependent peptidase
MKGITEKELADAKVSLRSAFYDSLGTPIGRAHALSVLALFRDDPPQINKLLEPYMSIQAGRLKEVAEKYLVPSNRTVIDRVPEEGGK